MKKKSIKRRRVLGILKVNEHCSMLQLETMRDELQRRLGNSQQILVVAADVTYYPLNSPKVNKKLRIQNHVVSIYNTDK